jgi:phosphoserine phosphatase RsbU/P
MTIDSDHKFVHSLSTFLTDGGLARLCAEIESMVGLAVHLRDERGRRIEAADGDKPWRIVETDAGDTPGCASFPLVVEGQRIGWICLEQGEPTLSDDARDRLEGVLDLVAATASELCADVLELRHRLAGLEVLYKLSSLMVSGLGIEEILQTTLDAAIEALELDSGSIVLLPRDADGLPTTDDEAELQLAASRGLSQEWLDDPRPVSCKRLFDRQIFAGQVVTVEDLMREPAVPDKQRCAAQGVASFIGAGIVFRDRLIGVIRLYGRHPRAFSKQDEAFLRSIGQQAGVAVNQASLLLVQKEERRIQRQLALASDIQTRMLPQRMPQIDGLDVAARYEPCFELGGDFYDLIERDGRLGVVIGDVVGKGVAAALLMAALRSSLRAHADEDTSLGTVLSRVNEAMCRDTLEHEFATIWFGAFDPRQNLLTYGSAGHDPPLLVRRGVKDAIEIEELAGTGLVVGVLEEQKYEQWSCRIEPGDVFVGYTDGATDATNFDGQRYGRVRLRESLARLLKMEPDASAERIVEHLRWDLRRFVGLAPQKDDETIVVVRMVELGD